MRWKRKTKESRRGVWVVVLKHVVGKIGKRKRDRKVSGVWFELMVRNK